MPKLITACLLTTALPFLGGCLGTQAVATSTDPNPPLPYGYRVNCTSRPSLIYGLTHAFVSSCDAEIAPGDRRAVIRARG